MATASATMSYGSGTRRWRKRQNHAKPEAWLSLCLLVLVLSAAFWLGHSLQPRAVYAVTGSPQAHPLPVAQPAHAAAPAVPPARAASEQTIALIQTIWGADWEVGVAIAVCESTLQPDAVHSANPDGSEDVGLFQINSIHGRSKEELLDPVANTRFAYSLFQAQALAPWESSRHCWEGKLAGP